MFVRSRFLRWVALVPALLLALELAPQPVFGLPSTTGYCPSAATQLTDPAADPVTWDENGEVRRFNIDGQLAVEQLVGSAALAHLQNMKSRQPQAFAAATKALRARGFEPTEIVFVQRTLRLASTGNRPGLNDGAPIFAEYTESNSEGEITLWSWDDGNNDTWEGTIYVEKYGGESAMAEGQLDIATENYWWYYTNVVWESGSGPFNKDVRYPFDPRGSQPNPPYLVASVPFLPQPFSPYMLARDWIRFFKDYRACVVGWCTGAAVACAGMGPGWPACWGFACVGAQIGCFIDNYW